MSDTWDIIKETFIKEHRVTKASFDPLLQKAATLLEEDEFYQGLSFSQQVCWLQYKIWTRSDRPPLHSDEDFPGDRKLIKKLLMQEQIRKIDQENTTSLSSAATEEKPTQGNSRATNASSSASSSKNDAPVDNITDRVAGMGFCENFPPLGVSYSGAAQKGSKLPDPEDAMTAHWRIVQENIRAEERRRGGFNSQRFEQRQANAAKRFVNGPEKQKQMDANLLLVDPRPDGKSTYIVTLPYTPAIKNALWGENRSFYAAKDVLGLNINFKANGTQLIIFPEPKRGDETLFDKPNIVKDRLDFAHGALKFWKRRVETDIALQKQLTELKVACDMWNNTDSSQVDHYFTEVPKKKDDRFNPRSDPQPEPSTASDAEAAKATKSEDVKTEKEEIETIYLQDGSVVETETTTKSREDTQATDTTWHGAGNQRSWQRATGHRFPSAKAPSKTLFAGKKVEVSEASEGDTKASGDATKAQPAAETAASETAESTKEVDKEPAKPSFSPFDDDDFSAFQPVSRSKKAAAKKRGGLGSSSG